MEGSSAFDGAGVSEPPENLAGADWAFSSHEKRQAGNSHRLLDPGEWPSARAELLRFSAGIQENVDHDSHEIAILLSGKPIVRRVGDGQRQEGLARPGSAWICPAGTFESYVEAGAPGDWLFVFLPPDLVGHSALAEHGIDPTKLQLAYVGGVVDPVFVHIGACFRGLLGREEQPTDRLFVDGLRTALSAHLIANYSGRQREPPVRLSALDEHRLKNVVDFIEANLFEAMTLASLAEVACLSPFHFARTFRLATGTTPHRYVIERRIEVAKHRLAQGSGTLFEIALDTGFGSQANFNRVFRKATGFTPGAYRTAHKGSFVTGPRNAQSQPTR